MSRVRLECTEGSSKKFWEGEVAEATLTVRFGRLGTAGQTKAKQLASCALAQRELDKLVAEKLRKGYLRIEEAQASTTTAAPAKPKVSQATRFKFHDSARKRYAWIELEGRQVRWAEGHVGTLPVEAYEEEASASAAIAKRDAVIAKWLKQGFELQVSAPPPLKSKPSAVERGLAEARKAEQEGRLEAASARYQQVFAEVFGEDSDELSNIVDLTWRGGALVAVGLNLDPGWLETQLKKDVALLFSSPIAAQVEEVTLHLVDGAWWSGHAQQALQTLARAACAARLKRIRIQDDKDHYLGSVDGVDDLPATEFRAFGALRTLELATTLLTVSPGPELAGLKSLARTTTELFAAEFLELTKGSWTGLEELSIQSDSIYLGAPGEELHEELVDELRSSFERFISSGSFSALRSLLLRLPPQIQVTVGDVQQLIQKAPIGQGLHSLRVEFLESRPE